MGIERITKKLVPALQDISGAILMMNAIDPQLATFFLFASAVSHLPNFIVINKVDKISDTEALTLANKFSDRQVILASMKTGRGVSEIESRLVEGFEGKVAVLGIFNAGKTSLINALTGEDNQVGNIPGTTLELSSHPYKHLILIDTVGQIIDIDKPLMVSVDLTECKTTKEKLTKCITEDIDGIYSTLETAIPGLEQAVELILDRTSLGNKIVVVGAGASALVAMEMAGQGNETGLPIMVFTNDFASCQPLSFAKGIGETELGIADYFSQAIQWGDVVIGISASGGTGFVYALLEMAKEKKAHTIAITENIDTPLGQAADVIIKSNAKPEGPSSSKIQVAHLAIGHALILTLADMRGIDAEKAISYMLPSKIPNKRAGIK